MRLVFAHIAILLSVSALSQTQNYEREIRIKSGFGTLLPHRTAMKHLHTGHAKVLEASYNFNTFGNRYFHKAFNYPQIGLAAGIYDIGNPEYVGLTYAFTPTISLPLGKYLPNFKFGIGTGYVSKPFNFDTNTKNIAIGSHWNAAILIEFEKSAQVNERLKLYYSASMMHYSNGAAKLPNLGLNTLTFNLGLSYGLGKKTELKTIEFEEPKKKLQFTPFLYFGWRQNAAFNPVTYGVGEVSLEFAKRINQKGKFQFGLDAIWNSSVAHLDELNHLKEPEDYLPTHSNFQSGIFAGYALVFDDVSVLFHQGIYVRNLYKERGMFYQRLALRKQFGEKLYANVGLKAHLAVAEYLEIGFGYTIGK